MVSDCFRCHWNILTATQVSMGPHHVSEILSMHFYVHVTEQNCGPKDAYGLR